MEARAGPCPGTAPPKHCARPELTDREAYPLRSAEDRRPAVRGLDVSPLVACLSMASARAGLSSWSETPGRYAVIQQWICPNDPAAERPNAAAPVGERGDNVQHHTRRPFGAFLAAEGAGATGPDNGRQSVQFHHPIRRAIPCPSIAGSRGTP